MKQMLIYTGLCVLLVLVVCANVKAKNEAAEQANKGEADSVQKIVISGTGDSAALIQALAKKLTANLGRGEIEIPESIGSTAGIKAVLAGKADLARVARPLKQSERELGLTCQIFAGTPVVFAVHPDINGIDNITTEQILGIYSGKITDWSQLDARPGKIYPLTREQGDSALQVLNGILPGFADTNCPAAKVVYLTPEAVAALQEHKQTIGFVPLSAMVNTNLKVLKVDGVEPSVENVLSGEYKFVIQLGVVYKGQPEGLTKEFIDFLYSEDAQKIIKAMGAVPLK